MLSVGQPFPKSNTVQQSYFSIYLDAQHGVAVEVVAGRDHPAVSIITIRRGHLFEVQNLKMHQKNAKLFDIKKQKKNSQRILQILRLLL